MYNPVPRNGRRLHYKRTYLQPNGRSNDVNYGANPGACMERVGKKLAGRELDGCTWDEYPQAVGESLGGDSDD